MRLLREIMAEAKDGNTKIGKLCEAELISKGYIKCFLGWEKIETLKQFGLYGLNGVPVYSDINDKGEKVIGVQPYYLDYMAYKKHQEKIDYAKDKNMERIIEELPL